MTKVELPLDARFDRRVASTGSTLAKVSAYFPVPFLSKFLLKFRDRVRGGHGDVQGPWGEFAKGSLGGKLGSGGGARDGSQNSLVLPDLSLDRSQNETPGSYVGFRCKFAKRGNAKRSP